MALREQNYNLARDFLDAGQPADALPLLEQLAGEAPRQWRFQLQLAQCYIALRRREEAKRILKALLAGPKQDAERSQAEDEPEPAEPRRRQWADLLMGIIQLEEGKSGQALDSLLRAEASNPDLPHLHLRIGQTYMRLQKLEDAERSFQRALEIDPESPEVHVCLARVRLRQGRNAEAIDEALQGVGLQHFLPLGHFYLGVALARLGQVQRAMLAFETSVSMQPGLLAAHRWLAALYSRPEGDSAKAEQHRSLYRQLRGRAARKLA
jgi:tetratricopeptide (TPR) repeat protein